MNKDLEHLRLLVIFHYIVAAITALYCSFPLLHVFIGLMLTLNPQAFEAHGRPPGPERFFGLIFVLIGGAVVVGGWTLAGITAYAGRCLARREKHTFCLVAACLNCLHPPLGTALGVFALLVLLRDSVKPLFEAYRPLAPPAWPAGQQNGPS